MSTITSDKVLQALSHHIGESNSVCSDRLVSEITQSPSNTVEKRFMRNVIKQLRADGYHICGTPHTGYYMAETMEELNKTCGFLYKRAMCSLTQIAAMKKVSIPDLSGQLNLPT